MRVVVTMRPGGVCAVGDAVEACLLEPFAVKVSDESVDGYDVGVASTGAFYVSDWRIQVALGLVFTFLVVMQQVNELHPVVGEWF
jgi:hypothetical protein